MDDDFITIAIEPRHDKTLAEIQYKINNKNLNTEQARKYFVSFSENLDLFEEHFNLMLIGLIEEYTCSSAWSSNSLIGNRIKLDYCLEVISSEYGLNLTPHCFS